MAAQDSKSVPVKGKESTETKRNKPKFLRKDWHKKIKLGSTVKKNRKWRGCKGRQNKIRMSRRGHSVRPKIGWSAESDTKGRINGIEAFRIENIKQLESVQKGQGIIIASVGKKKKEEITNAANEKKITILNKYKKTEEKK